MAVSLGIPQVTALLPGNQESAPDAQAPAMDSDLQLQILRELTQTLAEKPDINEVCQLVIEGIHRAIGMQRVALLMTDRSGELLVPRKVGGRGTEEWREHFIKGAESQGPVGRFVLRGQCGSRLCAIRTTIGSVWPLYPERPVVSDPDVSTLTSGSAWYKH